MKPKNRPYWQPPKRRSTHRSSRIPVYRPILRAPGNGRHGRCRGLEIPKRPAYYSFTLRHYTTTDLTADQIHALGLQELERIHAEMRTIFDELGYPKDASLADLYGLVARDGGIIPQRSPLVLRRYHPGGRTKIRPGVRPASQGQNHLHGRAARRILHTTGDRWLTPGDVLRRGTRRLPSRLADHDLSRNGPGHHLQIAIAQELSLPALRKGWISTHTLRLGALCGAPGRRAGVYDHDPYGNLGVYSSKHSRHAPGRGYWATCPTLVL